MSLNYDLRETADFDAITTDEAWPVTQAIIFATMAVGIGDLSEANLPEFYARISLYEQVGGAFLREFTDDGPVDRPLTYDDLRARVGLKTNVFPVETRAKWLKRVVGNTLDDRVREAKAKAR